MGTINKYILVILSAVFAIGTILVGLNYASSKMPTDPNAGVQPGKTQEELTVANLYLNNEHVFLAENISDLYIETINQKQGSLSEGDKQLLVVAEAKWAIQKQLNELYDVPVLVGDKVIEAAKLDSGVTETAKQQVTDALASKGITDGFAAKVNEILASKTSNTGHTGTSGSLEDMEITTQAGLYAKSRLEVVVQNNQVVEGFTMDGYINARDAIAQVPEGSEKEALLEVLAIVEKRMTDLQIPF